MESVEQFQFRSACWFSAGWTLDVWSVGGKVESKLTLTYPGTAPEDKWHTVSFRAPSTSGEVEIIADEGASGLPGRGLVTDGLSGEDSAARSSLRKVGQDRHTTEWGHRAGGVGRGQAG